MKGPKHFLINFSQMFYSAEMLWGFLSFQRAYSTLIGLMAQSVVIGWSYAYSVSKLHYHIWISAYTIIH